MTSESRRWNQKLAGYQRRQALRWRAINYLGGRCVICGYAKCAAAFDFHHPNPLEKDFNISSKMTSWEAILPELSKCLLLCARCHREVHDGLHAGYLIDDSALRGDLEIDEEDDPLDDQTQ